VSVGKAMGEWCVSVCVCVRAFQGCELGKTERRSCPDVELREGERQREGREREN
jgi:hypothetical protein